MFCCCFVVVWRLIRGRFSRQAAAAPPFHSLAAIGRVASDPSGARAWTHGRAATAAGLTPARGNDLFGEEEDTLGDAEFLDDDDDDDDGEDYFDIDKDLAADSGERSIMTNASASASANANADANGGGGSSGTPLASFGAPISNPAAARGLGLGIATPLTCSPVAVFDVAQALPRYFVVGEVRISVQAEREDGANVGMASEDNGEGEEKEMMVVSFDDRSVGLSQAFQQDSQAEDSMQTQPTQLSQTAQGGGEEEQGDAMDVDK